MRLLSVVQVGSASIFRVWRGMSRRRKWSLLGLALIFASAISIVVPWWMMHWPYRLLLSSPMGHYVIASSPDGSTMVTTLPSGTLRLWDMKTGESRGNWANPDNRLRPGGSFSKDGRLFAALKLPSPGKNFQIELIEVATGLRRVLIDSPKSGLELRGFLEDGQTLRLVVADKVARELLDFDLATGMVRIRRPLTAPLHYSSFWLSEDSRHLVLVGSTRRGMVDSVKVWDLDSDREVWALVDPPGKSPLEAARLSTDRKTLAISRNDGTIEVWDTATSSLRNQFQVHSPGFRPRSLSMSPDGLKVASFAKLTRPAVSIDFVRLLIKQVTRDPRPELTELVVLDLATGRKLGRLEGEGPAVIFAKDARSLVTSSKIGVLIRDLPESP